MQYNIDDNGGGESASAYSDYTLPRHDQQLNRLSAPQQYFSWGAGDNDVANNAITSVGLLGVWCDLHRQHSQSCPASSSHEHTQTTLSTLEHGPDSNETMYYGASAMQCCRVPSSMSCITGVRGGMLMATSSHESLNNFGSFISDLSSTSAYPQDMPRHYRLKMAEDATQSYVRTNDDKRPVTTSSYVARAENLNAGSATGLSVPGAYNSHFTAGQPSSQMWARQSSSPSGGNQYCPYYPPYNANSGFQQNNRDQYFSLFEVKRRRRTTMTQFSVLEGIFREHPKPTASMRKQLSEQLDMPLRAVQIWFQNRRAKAKAIAKKETANKIVSTGSSSASIRKNDTSKSIQGEGQDQYRRSDFRSKQTTSCHTTDARISSEKDDHSLDLIITDCPDSSFNVPGSPASSGFASFNQATLSYSEQPFYNLGFSSAAFSSSTISAFSKIPKQIPVCPLFHS